MASLEPRAAPDRRVKLARTSSSTGLIPVDCIYEILLRVPAKDLCRFRAVCRPWRSLLSDPHFIDAHAAHHPEPLIVAGYHTTDQSHGILCDIVDLSGRVVKRVRSTWFEDEWAVFTQLDLICIRRENSRRFIFLDPADGVVYALPGGLAEEHEGLEDICGSTAWIVFGLVAPTGEYKVFRVLESRYYKEQCCEVCTLGSSIHFYWRAKDHSTDRLDMLSRVVINGIVYFFLKDLLDQGAELKRIASFDLETEEWRATLQGPQINLVADAIGMLENQMNYADLSMAALNGNLVVVNCFGSTMDLWFLTDFENSLWVKQHSIQVNLSSLHDELHVRPLLVLNDGRIVTYVGPRGSLRIFNPSTGSYTDVAVMGPRLGIGLYTGNLLRLVNRAS